MTHLPLPPTSPRDLRHAATAADLAQDPVTLATWCDYAAWLIAAGRVRQKENIRRYSAAAARAVADREALAPSGVPETLIIDGAPYTPLGPRPDDVAYQPNIDWEAPTGAEDMRPTLTEAVAVWMMRGNSIYAACRRAGISHAFVGIVIRCERIPNAAHRAAIAALVGYAPDAIRWPVRITAHHESEVA